MSDSECYFWEVGCRLGEAITAAGDSIIAQWAHSMLEGVSETLIRLGTWWTSVPTPRMDGGVVSFIHDSTVYVTLALVIASVMIAGIQIVWTGRGEPARKLAEALFAHVVVSTIVVSASQMLIGASDLFSRWIIQRVVDGDEGEFAVRILDMSTYAAGGLGGFIVVIVLGLIALLANLAQVGLIFVRSAMLILLVGATPIAVSMMNTSWGRSWAQRFAGWFAAFMVFKPAASIVYAAAVLLISGDGWSVGDGDNMISFIIGTIMLVLATLTLPALITFMVPAAAAISSGSGGGGGVAGGVAVIATGAATVQRMSSSSAAGGGGGEAPRGASGAAGSSGPAGAGQSGATGGHGQAGTAGTNGGSGAGGNSGSSGMPGTAGATGATGGAGSAGARGAGGAAGSTGAVGAAGGGAAAKGAAAAGGPVGAGVAAGVQVAGQLAGEAKKAAESSVSESDASGAQEAQRS